MPTAGIAGPPVFFESRGVGGGGALFSPSMRADALYVASDMGELFRSNSFGASWQMVSQKEFGTQRSSDVQFTSNPLVLFSLGQSHGGTLAKSTDGGVHWSGLPTNFSPYALFADPARETRLISNSYSSLYLSNNAGSSFSQVYTTSNTNGLRIAGVLFNGNQIYVGTNIGLLISNDGLTFTLSPASGIPATEAIASFSGAVQNGVVRLFALTLDPSVVYPGVLVEDGQYNFRGVYSLDIGSATWLRRTNGIASYQHPYLLSTATNNISVVYLAGSNDSGAPMVLKSTDAGAYWWDTFLTSNNQNIDTGWQGSGGDSGWWWGGLALGFKVDPLDAQRAVITDLGFAHGTKNGGTSWQQLYVNPADQNPAGALTPKHRVYRGAGLQQTTVWQLLWSDPQTIHAAFTDITSIRSTDGGQSWSFPTYAVRQNTIYNFIRGLDGRLYGSSSSIHDLYQSTYLTDARIDVGTGMVIYSTNSGANWYTLHDFSHPVAFVTSDPVHSNRLYAGVVHSTAGGIYVTDDLQNGTASTWRKLTAPPRTEGHPWMLTILDDGSLLAVYSGRRNDLGFTASSGVFLSTDGGATWSDRTSSNMLYWTKDVVIDPTDPAQNTWYAGVTNGWGGPARDQGGLYKTTNRGVSWAKVFSGDSVESVTINAARQEIYMTTVNSGLYWGRTSGAFSVIPADSYPFRQPLRVQFNPYDPNEMWVTSFGGGLFVGRVQ